MQITKLGAMSLMLAAAVTAAACIHRYAETATTSPAGKVPAVAAANGPHALLQPGNRERDGKGRPKGLQANLVVRESPPGLAVLGSPTDDSITASVFTDGAASCWIEYGTSSGKYPQRTAEVDCDGRSPRLIDISDLRPDTKYYYRVVQRHSGSAARASEEFSFHTARPSGAGFSFAILADPHLDERTNLELYELTLANIRNAQPDFLLDLGDTVMLDKLGRPSDEQIVQRLATVRSLYGETCNSVPLLAVQGNHDGEAGWENGSQDSLAQRACRARLEWLAAPRPGFYSCAPAPDPDCGERGGYYSWQWGDVQLIVLDPYWATMEKPQHSGDGWSWTLGDEQYEWLRRVLASTTAEYKLVFIHHLVGGTDTEGRGGTEAAPYYEWGGGNADGSWGFDTRRPGWSEPIHQLLVKQGVDIVFHGHDHFYCRQELDGVVYQLVPQPGNASLQPPMQAEEYGYRSGDILPGSGYLRVSASAQRLLVEYIQSVLPEAETAQFGNGRVAAAYEIRSH